VCCASSRAGRSRILSRAWIGDSYAHRRIDGSKMYPCGFGNAVEIAHVEGGGLRNPHAPDFLNRRPQLYKEYSLATFDLFTDPWKQTPAIDRDKFEKYVGEVSTITGDCNQITKIKSLLERPRPFLLRMTPPGEPLRPWNKFRLSHPGTVLRSPGRSCIMCRRVGGVDAREARLRLWN
jgi:hypothetical protein